VSRYINLLMNIWLYTILFRANK